LHTLDFIMAGIGAVFAHVMVRLWHNRATPGALPCLALFMTLTVYLFTLVIAEPLVIAMQVGYVASAVMTPLLLVTAVAYIGLHLPGRRLLSTFSILAVAGLAVLNILTDGSNTFSALAGAADLQARSELIKDARAGPLITTMWSSYVFVTLTVGVGIYAFITRPGRRWEMAILIAVPGMVMAADVAHVTSGLTVAGASPTPYAMVAGVFLAICGMFRTRMFDVRPMARNVLIDSVKDGMLVVNHRRRIIDCNQTAGVLLEQSRDTLFGGSANDLLPREISALMQSTVHLRSELAARVNGRQRWFEVDVTPLMLRGRRAGHVIVIRDISERHQVQNALAESRRALEAANARLVEQSVTDPLTNLKNRRFLFARLNEELSRSQRSGTTLGLLLIDIDHFKRVNDTHGHPVGDEALVQVAAALAGTVRDCDVVARLGGEEFAVLAVNAEARGLVGLANRIRKAISRVPVAQDTDQPMILTVSIGVGFASQSTATADELFTETDRYLYRAKHEGRNQVVAGPSDLEQAG